MNVALPNGNTKNKEAFSSTYDASAYPDAGNIDKVRDILFGSIMRDYEQRFARLEEALRKESLDLRESTRRRLETLEAFVQQELIALETRLNTEGEEREQSRSSLAAELTSTSSNKGQELIGLLEHQAQALQHSNTDTAALAGLLHEVALWLSGYLKATAAD
jgi:hypothetical protein